VSRRTLPLLAILVLAPHACHDAPTRNTDAATRAALAGVWTVTQVDTQTVAPFVTHCAVARPSGNHVVSELLAESLALDTSGAARRHVATRMSEYQGTVLVDGPTVFEFQSVGSFAPTMAVVLDARDSAVALSLHAPPGENTGTYTMYLARTDSALLYRYPMQDSCSLGLIGGDRVAHFTRR